MKKLILTAIALTTVLGVSAQNRVFNNPDNKAYLGVRLSLDMTVPQKAKLTLKEGGVSMTEKDKMFKTGAGVGAGVIYNIPVIANFYVEPGLDLYYNTKAFDDILGEDEAKIDMKNNSVRTFGMRIPIQLGYHFDFTDNISLAVYTGPVVNVGFSSDYYLTTKEVNGVSFHESGSMYKGDDDEMKYNRAALDWRIGVGVNYKNLYFGLSGDLGMTNLIHNPKSTKDHYKYNYHQNLCQITLGYNFK